MRNDQIRCNELRKMNCAKRDSRGKELLMGYGVQWIMSNVRVVKMNPEREKGYQYGVGMVEDWNGLERETGHKMDLERKTWSELDERRTRRGRPEKGTEQG